MKLTACILTVTVALCATGCEANVQDQETLYDAARASKATLTLRVKFLKSLGGDKYTWDEVEVLQVLRGTGAAKGASLEIAHRDTEPGIPEGESTVYLEPYENDKGGPPWILLDGSAKSGVSHTK